MVLESSQLITKRLNQSITATVPTIFLIDNHGEIAEMSDQPYDSEALLQELLAKYPSVLAGDQMSGSAPVRRLLVAREVVAAKPHANAMLNAMRDRQKGSGAGE
jgi:hypothetical protein